MNDTDYGMIVLICYTAIVLLIGFTLADMAKAGANTILIKRLGTDWILRFSCQCGARTKFSHPWPDIPQEHTCSKCKRKSSVVLGEVDRARMAQEKIRAEREAGQRAG